VRATKFGECWLFLFDQGAISIERPAHGLKTRATRPHSPRLPAARCPLPADYDPPTVKYGSTDSWIPAPAFASLPAARCPLPAAR